MRIEEKINTHILSAEHFSCISLLKSPKGKALDVNCKLTKRLFTFIQMLSH
jgi:hypothetical protein